jgi:rare lipoprotein A
MVRNGTAFVELRSIDPSAMAPSTLSASNVAAPEVFTVPLAATAIAAAPAHAAPHATTAPPQVAAAPPQVAAAPPSAAPVKVGAPLFVQAGAFGDPANAQRLAQRLRGGAYGNVFVRDDQIAGRRMYRVRIGPVPNVAEFDRVVAALERDGVQDAHLALD